MLIRRNICFFPLKVTIYLLIFYVSLRWVIIWRKFHPTVLRFFNYHQFSYLFWPMVNPNCNPMLGCMLLSNDYPNWAIITYWKAWSTYARGGSTWYFINSRASINFISNYIYLYKNLKKKSYKTYRQASIKQMLWLVWWL